MSPTDALQVIDADANFDERAATRAAEAAGLPRAADGRYGVVAVMGPQSSGKSTLLNAMVRLSERGEQTARERTSKSRLSMQISLFGVLSSKNEENINE